MARRNKRKEMEKSVIDEAFFFFFSKRNSVSLFPHKFLKITATK